MIDLSYKPKSEKTEEEPIGAIILEVMPICLLFFWLVVRAL